MSDEYATSASVYDAIYENMKDYAKEANRVHELVLAHKRSQGNDLLDVACGTGLHLQWLEQYYRVTGIDFSEEMLKVARKRLPKAEFYQLDMRNRHFGTADAFPIRTPEFRRDMDVVTCLFSAIGHMLTKHDLHKAIANMAVALKPGGVLLVEPWLTPEEWDPGRISTNFVPDKKVARITQASLEGNVALLDMHHFVGWPKRTKYLFAHHELALYTVEEYTEAFQAAGLEVTHDKEGLMGRGVYIGVKNS